MMAREFRDWDFSLGPVFGTAGTITTLTQQMQCDFKVQKVYAMDSSGNGTATRIMNFLVGQQPQRPTQNGSTLATFFGPGTLGNGVCWATCTRGLSIAVTVSFVQDGTFDMSLFGRGVL